MKRVLCIHSQAADLGRAHAGGSRDVACFLAIAEERERDAIRGGEFDGVPFQDDGGLGCVFAAEDGGEGLGGAEGGVDCVLEGEEGGLGFLF